ELMRQGHRIHRLFNLLPLKLLSAYIKQYLLNIEVDDSASINRLHDIFGQELYSYTEETGRSLGDILWDAYLDEANGASENKHLLKILVDMLNFHCYADRGESFRRIHDILREADLNKTGKAIDVVLRLSLDEERSDDLFLLLHSACYKKEVLAAFCLVHSTLFGVKQEYLHSWMSREYPGPVSQLLGPEVRSIYYYLQRIEDVRRKGGALKSDTDSDIFHYTRGLDRWAAAPGINGFTWFSSLRQRIHQHPSSGDLKVVRTLLYFIKYQGEEILAKASQHDGLITSIKKDFGEERGQRYSSIINNTLRNLKQAGKIQSLKEDHFLDELLSVPRQETFSTLKEANPEADEDDIQQLEFMIGLYYALSERYGVVYADIVPAIKGHSIPGDMFHYMVDFMRDDYDQLLSVIDSDDYSAILSAIARCRERIKHRLIFEKVGLDTIDSEDEDSLYEYERNELARDRLMEFDNNLFLLGKEMLGRVYKDIERCRSLRGLKKHIDSLVAMARFLLASGLGGVELEQFVLELEHGRLRYSQLYDLVRGLRMEVHKITRKINENIRFAMAHVWETHEYYKLTEAWQKEVKPERVETEYGHEREVVTQDEQERVAGVVVDTLVQDSGILVFDETLMMFNDILQIKLTPEKDRLLYPKRPKGRLVVDEQFFRFGQPEVIPREGLLSLWSKKGLNLVRMTQEDIDVPPGVIISAKLITKPRVFKSPRFKEKVEKEIALIRKYTKYPDLRLLLYARSGSAFTLPGLLVTIPNIGMNDEEVKLLAQSSNDEWFAYDTYAEFMRSFAINVLGIPEDYFQGVVNIYEKDELTPTEMKEVCSRYKEIIALQGRGQKIPDKMIDQVLMAVDAVYASWDSKDAQEYRARHRISPEWGTVVILQKGVFGNLNPTEDGRISGTGAAALRILPDGREIIQGKFRFRSIGDQVMSRADQNYVLLSKSEKVLDAEQTLEELQPQVYHSILDYAHRLKEIFANNQHFEFTVELNKVWVTQTNDDLVKDDYPEFVDSPEYEPIARGHGVSGGALRGWVADSFDAAQELLAKYKEEQPEDVDGVILFLNRVNPEIINQIPKGVHIVARIISVHAETLAQKYGITVVYGVPGMLFDEEECHWYVGGMKMVNGDTISIDGHENQLIYHNSGNIYFGSVPIAFKEDDKILVERRTGRALDAISSLRDQEQWQEAMAKKKLGINPFEREVLVAFAKYMQQELFHKDIVRYVMNYRLILDKIARLCEDLDFELYGDAFKQALEEKLAQWDIGFELFMQLRRRYYPLSVAHRETINAIHSRLNYIPSAKTTPSKVEVSDMREKAVQLDENSLWQGEWPAGRYFVLNPPKDTVRLVSLGLDGVLEEVVKYGFIERLIELFRVLKEGMGLKVVVTSSDRFMEDWWYKDILGQHPEIGQYVDGCYGSLLSLGFIDYQKANNLKNSQIMHFGNIEGWTSWSEESPAAALHREGFVGVLVGNHRIPA
ncbi:hypothetical protein ACFL2W_00565, partial [Candidatus Omnitrophota bacterium]